MKKETKLEKLAKAAAEYWELPLERLMSRDRQSKVSWPRAVCMFIAVDAGIRSIEVGKFWGRHHSTVTHSRALVAGRVGNNSSDKKQVLGFVAFLKSFLNKPEQA